MRIGIGYANEPDAYHSGIAIARKAVADGNISDPGFALAFCHGELDHQKFFEGLQSVLGKAVPIVGGSAIGIITNKELSYSGYPAGVAIISSDEMTFRTAYGEQLDNDEEGASRKAARQIVQGPDDRVLLVFYDSIKIPATPLTPPIMNASPLVIKGLESVLHPSVPIIGAGVVGHTDFRPAEQFSGDHVGTQHVVASMIGGDFSIYHCIMHGLTPMDGVYHTITEIEGPTIRRLDDRPIVSVINELYGDEEWQKQRPLKRLAIGVNRGDKYGPFNEEHYINRLIMGVLPDKDGIVIFEPDLEPGMQVQFMFRDSNDMDRSVREKTKALLHEIAGEGKTPFFGLYIDCAGRCAELSDTLTEEAEGVQQLLNQSKTPLFGFYSGCEIAPVLGRSRGLDWTGVLTVFAR